MARCDRIATRGLSWAPEVVGAVAQSPLLAWPSREPLPGRRRQNVLKTCHSLCWTAANQQLELDVVEHVGRDLRYGPSTPQKRVEGAQAFIAEEILSGRQIALSIPYRDGRGLDVPGFPLTHTIGMSSLIGIKCTPHPWAPIANCFFVQVSKTVAF